MSSCTDHVWCGMSQGEDRNQGGRGVGTRPQARSAAPAYVYFAQAAQDGPIKIGAALNPKNRLYELRSRFGTGIQIIAAIRATRRFEHVLHQRFRHIQAEVKGDLGAEWFFPARELLAFIEANAAPYSGEFITREEATR